MYFPKKQVTGNLPVYGFIVTAMFTAPQKPMRRFAAEPATLAPGTLQRQTIDLDCGRVAYLRHGPDKKHAPPLLLVHGIPTSARLWEPLLGILGQHYDCIVPDLLGLGRSVPSPGGPLNGPAQADMLAALLDALDITECFAAFHDQGGMHGAQMLKNHGQRLRAVVFTNCVCYDNWPVPVVDAITYLGNAIKPLARIRLAQLSLRVLWPLTVFRRNIPRAIYKDWEYALDTGGQALDDWIRYATSQSNYWTLDAVPALQAWDKPTMVLWAAQDRFLPVSWGARLAADIPGAESNPTLLPFAGHFWQTEVPESGANALHAFFSKYTGKHK